MKLRTFGGLSIENAGSMSGTMAQRRPLALLAMLAVAGRRGLSRDKIVALLWPESDAEHGRNSLSQVLSSLRRELAADDVVLGSAELSLNTDVLSSDVIEFEERIAANDPESAIRLYAGPFLDGVFLRNSPDFERWVDQQRSRLQHLQGDALERLATRASAAGDHTSAVRFWRDRANLVPSDSRAALKFAESLVAAGDPAGALEHYRVHRALLHDDLGVEPDAALVQFAASMREGIARTPDRPAASQQVAVPVPRHVADAEAPHLASAPRPSKRRVLLALATGATLVIGVAAAWSATSGRVSFGSPEPKPPTHDSLRLRIVTVLLPFDSADSTLARRIRDGAIAEMEKDPWLFVVTPRAWAEQAPLIGLGEVALMDPDTIRKYARKTRTHAIVDFGLSQVSSGFVITAEARGASTDSSLGVIAEAAATALDMPAAMARLNQALRERLVAARSSLPPTKWSLNTTDQPPQAIDYYVEGRSEHSRGNFIEAARRHRLAVEVDSTFAQAWRSLHASLANARLSVDEQLHAISAAFRFSHLVRGPRTRLDIVAAYYRAMGDYERALVFYDSLARIDAVQNVNAGLSYLALRRDELATRVYRRHVDASGRRSITDSYQELVHSLLVEDKVAEARREVAEMVRIDSAHPRTKLGRAYIYAAQGHWDSLTALGRSSLSRARSLTDSATGLQWVGRAAIGRGHLATFDSMATVRATIARKYGSSGDYLALQLERALTHATLAGDTARARAIADSALAVVSWQLLKQMDRPYLAMLLYLASVHDIERGDALAGEWSRRTPTEFKRRDSLNVLIGRGELALASGNAHDALRFIRLSDFLYCQTCFYPRYARAFDAIGEGDSARVWFERTATAVHWLGLIGSSLELPHTFRRLGELAEARGDVVSATRWYKRFVALWATSDIPALQASVRTIRGRLDKLGVAPIRNSTR
jgi:DNA-binding SARP family transcriptional activator